MAVVPIIYKNKKANMSGTNEVKKNKAQQEDYLSRIVSKQDAILDKVEHIYTKDMNTPWSVNSTLDYISVDLDMLPLGRFYKPGTKISIRAAKVSEVQAYSVVDNKSPVDVTDKMNHVLSACIKFIHPNGSVGSYKDVKDGDRIFIIFMIREITFQKGPSIAKDVACGGCKHKFNIPFRATNSSELSRTFEIKDMPEKLDKYFNREQRVFEFKVNNVLWKLAPPNIGIQETFFEDIKRRVQAGGSPNVSFLKIIPYTLWDKNTITEEGIKQREEEFERMDMYTFQFLNQAVSNMDFGLKGLVSKCPECGVEVRTEMTFPDGASGIFVLPSIFDEFVD